MEVTVRNKSSQVEKLRYVTIFLDTPPARARVVESGDWTLTPSGKPEHRPRRPVYRASSYAGCIMPPHLGYKTVRRAYLEGSQ